MDKTHPSCVRPGFTTRVQHEADRPATTQPLQLRGWARVWSVKTLSQIKIINYFQTNPCSSTALKYVTIMLDQHTSAVSPSPCPTSSIIGGVHLTELVCVGCSQDLRGKVSRVSNISRLVYVSVHWALSKSIQWIGLRENLNRKPWFLSLNMEVSCKFSHHQILWKIVVHPLVYHPRYD